MNRQEHPQDHREVAEYHHRTFSAVLRHLAFAGLVAIWLLLGEPETVDLDKFLLLGLFSMVMSLLFDVAYHYLGYRLFGGGYVELDAESIFKDLGYEDGARWLSLLFRSKIWAVVVGYGFIAAFVLEAFVW